MSTEHIKEEKLNIGAVLAVSLSTVIAMLTALSQMLPYLLLAKILPSQKLHPS